jgi:hypothetical protein
MGTKIEDGGCKLRKIEPQKTRETQGIRRNAKCKIKNRKIMDEHG